MDFILENLALGNRHDAADPATDVSALLCVAEELTLPAHRACRHKVPVADLQPIPHAQMREAVDWIRQHIGDRRILVYCNAGVGRSTTVAIGYLCGELGYGFGEAVEFVARRRPYMSILPDLITSIDRLRATPAR